MKQRLADHAHAINEAFLRHGVRSPFALHLDIPDARSQQVTAKVVLMLHQINLLRDVHRHRDILGSDELGDYEIWAAKVLGPWIAADHDLRRALAFFKDTGNWSSEGFYPWLSGLIAIQDE